MQSFILKEACAYGTSKALVSEKEEIKCNLKHALEYTSH